MSLTGNINNQSFGAHSHQGDCLSITISSDLISVCEFNITENKPLFVHHTLVTAENKIEDVFISVVKYFKYLEQSFSRILINYSSNQFTLCPTQLFVEENKKDILEFNTGTVGNKLVLVNEVSSDILLIYSMDEALKSIIDKAFPQHQLKHTISVLSKLMLQSDEFIKENILLYVSENHIEVVVKKEHKLLLSNQYSIKTTEDVLYYLLFILEQYEFNPLYVSVSVAGNTESTSPIVSSLKKYIKNVTLAKGNKSINWQGLQGMPQHFNFTLLNRLFCE